VTIDGGATKSISASGDVQLRGQVQTDAGNGGGLSLVATQGQMPLAASNGFSVSSIPQNYTDTFVKELDDDERGFVVQDDWDSDSGVFGDLDETEISEQVEVTKATGCFKGTGKKNSGYLAGNVRTQDTHSSPTLNLTKPGYRVATQTCMFKDKRSGATDIPMTRSGYKLVRDVTKKSKSAGGGLQYHVTKNGASVTANGIKSKAGSGSIDITQDV
jgi:hypothetical protein